MNTRWGIIDLGTNTFHLLIVEKHQGQVRTLFHESRPAKIGLGGINQNVITPEAIDRALEVLQYFRQQLDAYEIAAEHTFAYGTSAIRNADNQAVFKSAVLQSVHIDITIIDGDQEAEYIYYGVRNGAELGSEPALIVDIGGGSVEFIIGNDRQIWWKKSIEIGGQRLMDRFMKKDPIAHADQKRLYNYLEEALVPLANAMHQYAPQKLVGSSGTFDTLIDIDFQAKRMGIPGSDTTDFPLSLESFYDTFSKVMVGNHQERMAIPGMIALRADMIVVACCLIDYLLKTYGISEIQVSRYALKEGVLAKMLENESFKWI
ncbi:exopolyphosphatase/guanosine-5'-triphosphate,3'-diphosphate pyrophosphatase [Dyadobacter jejuensis]|uniref:Exopolyphosphatase/guanosine-5'-triphosphate, 3'-diphosphate pyrophosphatase n=1 Tax=Dyadobacter jejuensis TaxID=1082580 RepID=A0A316AR22_9BACT|nr:phosphatase [Dyadobacter jejuensis]PWJ59881.1 exopolyphosphatase/guanosine-5'-triphosphate,3'-diphosphate pyrophosphatase [Dyadobacter jejuensis]